MAAELILGVDAGATQTVAWLTGCRDEEPVGRGVGGPANPRVMGLEPACHGIDDAVAAAFTDARIGQAAVAAACLSVAGAGTATWRDAVRQRFAACSLAGRLLVTHDGEALLAAAGLDHGVGLVAGTGSLAWGRRRDGREARVGGWGHVLGDEGSGFALGLAALHAATRAADGRGPRTILLDRLTDRFDCRAPRDLIDVVGRAPVEPRRIASLAPLVLEAAASGDEVSTRLATDAARELAAMVDALRSRLEFGVDDFAVSLGGGLLVGSAMVRQLLQAALRSSGLRPSAVVIVEQPVLGAVRLARASCAERDSARQSSRLEVHAMSQEEQDRRIDYVELPVVDVEQAKRFYGEVFGWSFKDYGHDYASFRDGRLEGGFRLESTVQPGGPLIVMYALDLEGMRQNVTAAGGTIELEIFEFPGGRRFHFADPSGNVLAVWSDR